MDFEIDKPINPYLLPIELATALGDQFAGLATRVGSITVNFAADPQQTDIDKVNSVIAAHDATKLTPDQQAAAAQTQAVLTLKQSVQAVVDTLTNSKPTTVAGVVAVLTQLAGIIQGIANNLPQ